MKRAFAAMLVFLLLMSACGRAPAPGIDERLLDAYGMEPEEIVELLELTEKDRDTAYADQDFYKKEFDWFGRRVETRIGLVGKRNYQAQMKLEANGAFCETVVEQLIEQLGEPMFGQWEGSTDHAIRKDFAEALQAYLADPEADYLWLWHKGNNESGISDMNVIGGIGPNVMPLFCRFIKTPGQPDTYAVEIRLYCAGEFPEPDDFAAAKTTGIDERLLNAYGKSPEEAWEILELTEEDIHPDDPERADLHMKKYHWFGKSLDTEIVLGVRDSSPSGTQNDSGSVIYGAALHTEPTDFYPFECDNVFRQLLDQLGQPIDCWLQYPHSSGKGGVTIEDPQEAWEEFTTSGEFEGIYFTFSYPGAEDSSRPIQVQFFDGSALGGYQINVYLFDAAVFTVSR